MHTVLNPDWWTWKKKQKLIDSIVRFCNRVFLGLGKTSISWNRIWGNVFLFRRYVWHRVQRRFLITVCALSVDPFQSSQKINGHYDFPRWFQFKVLNSFRTKWWTFTAKLRKPFYLIFGVIYWRAENLANRST